MQAGTSGQLAALFSPSGQHDWTKAIVEAEIGVMVSVKSAVKQCATQG